MHALCAGEAGRTVPSICHPRHSAPCRGASVMLYETFHLLRTCIPGCMHHECADGPLHPAASPDLYRGQARHAGRLQGQSGTASEGRGGSPLHQARRGDNLPWARPGGYSAASACPSANVPHIGGTAWPQCSPDTSCPCSGRPSCTPL